MSHQITFRATPTDLELLETAFGKHHRWACITWRNQEMKPKQLTSFASYTTPGDDLVVFLVRPEDLDGVISNFVPAQRYWTVDSLRSPVVELTRCFIDKDAIRAGRLYYHDDYYGADKKKVVKPEHFRLWAGDLLETARKVFRRHGNEYVGAEAQHFAVLPLFLKSDGRHPEVF